MSKDHQQPYENDAGENQGDDGNRPLRHGWFYYVAGFFLVIAGICFVLGNNLNYQPPSLPRPPAATSGK